MSTTATPPPGTAPAPTTSRQSFIKFWSSVKLGVVLMLAIAVAAILGTVVPQGDPSVIQNLPSSDFTKRLLLAIQAHQVYYSPWFLGLLALFFFNLLLSTTRVAIPRLKVALRKPPELSVDVRRRHHGNLVELPAQPIEDVARAFRKAGYRVYPSRDGGVIAHKGRWSRFAPLVTHLGLFGILIGGLLSGLTSFKASVPLFEGEEVPVRYVIEKMAQPRGPLASANHDWSIRADRFWIDYYDEQTIMQYNSNLSVLQDGKVVATKSIFVNDPLVRNGVWFYQAFWGIGGVNLDVGGKPTKVRMRPGEQFGLEGYISEPFQVNHQEFLAYMPSERKPALMLQIDRQTHRPMPLMELSPGQSATLDGVQVRFVGPALYTGLQVKSDPGIPVVYTGFMVLILGSALAFFAVRQVWVGPMAAGGYLVSGKANRGHYAFQRELAKVATQLGAKNHATHAT